ncbi:3-hydroxyacyl-CoA dehydrogenase [Sporothrix brasiliensis 5110]|uniref:3-hydroxyacyl-CoA dehydrogenase n=1 Tax=Sporothrix brasiliensis 5110 TaxID=1398154 RepID=A0A0C2FTS5_9PEZI|nr:3-hydroxyacyl-CoA dehydrogenase [Sporothrix brasiliensis 5110]KIH94438.1 3-hydroxyacyl-CoA dehydrogenase [Sporothrix brasiliensis 5110]
MSVPPATQASARLDVNNLFATTGQVALITGGGTGIGLVMARAMAEAGAAKVYIAGRRLAVLESAAAAVNRLVSRDVLVPIELDVTSKASLAAAAAFVDKDSGFLDVVVSNAGVPGPQTPTPADNDTTTTLAEWRAAQLAVDPQAYQDTFKVNTTAVWFTAITFLDLLDAGNRRRNDSLGAARPTSQVVVISSLAGFNRKAPAGFAYGQSKSAATHAAKQLAVLLPRWGIRVNVVAPGPFPSEMTTAFVGALGATTDQEVIRIDKAHVPLGRIGDQQDMAGTILYLVSRAGAFLNGNVVLLDGGRLGVFPSMY